MQITERLLDTKRHTSGFAVGNTFYTRAQTIKLARQGKVTGVRVCNGPQGKYLSSTIPGESLYSLPSRVVGKIGRKTAAAKSRRKA
jgi:hypothetical protein